MKTVQELVEEMAGLDSERSKAALDELAKMSFRIMPDLMTILIKSNNELRKAAIRALDRIDPTWHGSREVQRLTPHLAQWIESPDPELCALGNKLFEAIEPEKYDAMQRRKRAEQKVRRRGPIPAIMCVVVTGLLAALVLASTASKGLSPVQFARLQFARVKEGDQKTVVSGYLARLDKQGIQAFGLSFNQFVSALALVAKKRQSATLDAFKDDIRKKREQAAALQPPMMCRDFQGRILKFYDTMLDIARTEEISAENVSLNARLSSLAEMAEKCDEERKLLKKVFLGEETGKKK